MFFFFFKVWLLKPSPPITITRFFRMINFFNSLIKNLFIFNDFKLLSEIIVISFIHNVVPSARLNGTPKGKDFKSLCLPISPRGHSYFHECLC